MPKLLSLMGAALLLLSGCSGLSDLGSGELSDLGWPPQAPRVRLERVVPLHRRPASRALRIFHKIADLEARPLLRRPYAAAWDGEDLLVTDPTAGRVARIDARGRVDLSPDQLLEGPIGIAACRAGIVVSDSRSGRLALLDPDLDFKRWLAEGLERPTGVTCRGDRIFVVETGKHRIVVYRIDPTGEPAAEPWIIGDRGDREGEFNFPAAAALDGDSLWIGDTLNFRLQRLDAETGTFQGGFGHLGDAPGEMPRIKGIAVDRDGHLWVSDAHLDQVALYDRTGTFLMAIGGRGDAPGEFSFPGGIASHPDGRVAVVDSLNRRLQIFRLVAPPGSTREENGS